MGILEFATIVLIILKVIGVISISWWIVFLPLILAVAWYLIVWGLITLGFIGTFFTFKKKRK